MTYKLIFKDLGRTKFSGSILVKKINYSQLSKAVKPYILSTPDFYINEDETKGKVLAGWYSWDFDIEKQ